MDTAKLKDILDKHLRWLRDEDGGERANLSGADLSGADLSGPTISKKLKIYFTPSPAQKAGLLSAGKRRESRITAESAS